MGEPLLEVSPQAPQTGYRQLVLAGGGHSHALVLLDWALRPQLRPLACAITLVSRSSTTLYSGLVPGLDDLDLWNNINVSRNGGVVQNVYDTASQTSYGRRTQSISGLLFTNDDESYDLATGILYQYKQPAARVRSLTLTSTINAGATLPQQLGRNLLDRITIN